MEPGSRPPPTPAAAESEARSEGAVKRDELFLRLRRDAGRWSRNRNFELYERPEALRTLRRVLWLRQLERDLAGCEVRRIEADREGAVVLELAHPALRLSRRVRLTPGELGALREGPLGERLAGELERAAEGERR